MSSDMNAEGATTRTAWALSSPAALLFVGVVAIPLLMTLLLSLNSWVPGRGVIPTYGLANWIEVFSDSYFLDVFLRTLRFSILVTLLTLVFGAPEAYILYRMQPRWRSICLLVVLGPLLVSVVARTLGWTLLFGGSNGVVNQALLAAGVISRPIPFMFTETGTIIALAHVLMPFMVLAVSASLQKLNPQIEHAAASLGARPFTVYRRIVLPQIMPGLLSGAIIVFAMAASSFATPAIIGGRRLKVASTLIYDEFLNSLNWPLGAAIAILLLLALVAIILGSNRLIERRYAEVFR